MARRLKTHTDYDLEQMEELQRIAGKYFARAQVRRKRSFALSWGALCVGVGLLAAVRQYNAVLSLLCCVLGLPILIWGIFFYPLTAWTAQRAMGAGAKIGNDFFFEKSEILAVQGTESARYAYADCAQMLETERNIYFILKDGQGLMLDKQNVRGGSVEELRRFLVEQTGQEVTWAGKKKNA